MSPVRLPEEAVARLPMPAALGHGRGLVRLAAQSAWNRRFALSLVLLSIALATLLLVGIERIRGDVRESFAQSVSGTDLIVGARTGSVELLLYSVFRIGSASNNIRGASVDALAAHRMVAWTVPLALGDSHRGFAVVGTTTAYFEHFRHGEGEPLRLAAGRTFGDAFEAVLGAEVARSLGYRAGQRIVLAHGDGALEENDHDDHPFEVVGVLAPTGTPVDRSVHVPLAAMQALHADRVGGVRLPATAGAAGAASSVAGPATALPAPAVGTTPAVTAVLVGLKHRAAVFSVQRWVAEYPGEPLMAVLPGVALDELWTLVGAGERALLAVGALVSVVSLAGLVAVILAGLNERRRELAILRAVGAGPRTLMWLLALEGGLVTLAGVALGLALAALALMLAGPLAQQHLGVTLRAHAPTLAEWRLVGAVLAGGFLASLLPGYRAYRLSLADGLAPRV